MNRRPEEHLNGKVQIRPMRLEDVPEVVAIDRVSFPSPWSEHTYRQELQQNSAAYLFTAESRDSDDMRKDIIGYIGFWFIVDEAHISTLAVAPQYRRQGFGRTILDQAIRRAARLGAEWITLEVRESNLPAIALYEDFGFTMRGRRPGYYRDTDEDALVMFLNVGECKWEKVRLSYCEC
jgi:ribosomal-protein-alanine N-acetyltransferase